MPSYTANLRLVQPATGEYSGTWGTQVNDSLTAVVDKAVAGTATITMTAANYILTNGNGVADEAKAMFLVLGGTPGSSRFVIVPSVSKLYFVTNNTGFAQSVSTSGSGGVSVPNGASMVLRCDGTNVVAGENYLASLSLGAALPTASGGTGLTSFTANAVVYASSTSNLATSSSFVFDSTNTRLGIGTSSPVSGIHVVGGSSASSRALRVESNSSSSTSPPLFVLYRSTTTALASQAIGQITFSRLLTDSTSETAAAFLAYGNNNAGSSTGILRSDALTKVEFYISGAEKFVVEGNYVRQTVITVATLPSAATAGVGSRAFVSDANSTTFASIVAGGGTNNVPVYSDGTNWRIG